MRCSKRSPPTSRVQTLNFETLQRGATGPRVREIQERLGDLTHSTLADPLGAFGDNTVDLVESFQRTRGLQITGVVDATTWSRLIEAGWQLGQRLLYLTQPLLRGDDVAELQLRLSQLGFNPGRIDGIFGPLLETALTDFQRNCALNPSGTLTRATLNELKRMAPVIADLSLVSEARDLFGFDDDVTGPLVVCGDGPLVELLVRSLSPTFDVHDLGGEPTDVVARRANDLSAAAVISVQVLSELHEVHLHYWASYRSHSRRGEQLASAIASGLSRSEHLPRVEVTGMALPILRETRMTTLHIEHGAQADHELEELAAISAQVFENVFHR